MTIEKPQSQSKITVLIVEDEFIIAQTLKAKLEEIGYEVIGIAAKGEKAIEIVNKTPPSVILMDIMLSGELDGIQTAELIKKEHNIPVLFTSAYSSDIFKQRAKVTEPYAYILKPYSEREVIINIEIAIYRNKIEQKLKETQEELKELNEQLEKKVIERTSELAEANKELKKLSMVVEQSHDSVIITNQNGEIEYVNPAFCEEYGYTFQEVKGKSTRILKSGVHNSSFYQILWSTVKAGSTFNVEFVNKNKNGDLLFEKTIITPLKDANENITNFVSTGKNVTYEKESQEEIATQQKFIASINDVIPVIIYVYDVNENKMKFINKHLQNILGYKTEELIGIGSDEIKAMVHPEDREEFCKHIKQVDSKISSYSEKCFRIIKKDGNYETLYARETAFEYDENGTVLQLIGSCSNISIANENEVKTNGYKEFKV